MVDFGIPVEGKIQQPPKQFDGQDLGADCGYPAAYDGVAGAKMRGFNLGSTYTKYPTYGSEHGVLAVVRHQFNPIYAFEWAS